MKLKLQFRFLLFVLFVLPAFWAGKTTYCQPAKDTLNVLFVGNSYTYVNNLPQIVSLISDSTWIKLVTKKSTAGGANLGQHWRGERNLHTRELIESKNFDIVVLQDHSMRAIVAPDSLFYYVQKLCDLVKQNGAKPYLYQTWAREKVPQFQNQISEVYKKAALENDAVLVKAGEAWELAQKLRPGIELFSADGSHPSPLGTFLTACVFVNCITNELPANLPGNYQTIDFEGETVRLMQVGDPLDVLFCTKVSEEIFDHP